MITLLCSGQGMQHSGMFDLTGTVISNSPIFRCGEKYLKCDPRNFVKEKNRHDLFFNDAAQILCTVQSLAAYGLIADLLPDRLCVAGYSVGEMAAWCIAGLFSYSQILDLVSIRAKLMDRVNTKDTRLISVHGLSRVEIDRLCHLFDCSIAIINPDERWVLGGEESKLKQLSVQVQNMGAKSVIPLNVKVASHTPLMKDATILFAGELRKYSEHKSTPSVRLMCSRDGSTVFNVEKGKDWLSAQLSSQIDWVSTLTACVEAGTKAFIELGPGSALSSMAGYLFPTIPSRSLDDFQTKEGIASWITGFN